MEWAVHQLGKDFRANGIDNKRINGAIELALLLLKDEAFLTDFAEAASALTLQGDAEP